MIAGPSVEPARVLHGQLSAASRDRWATSIDALMCAEADAICGSEYGARSAGRNNVRNGYGHGAVAQSPLEMYLLGRAPVIGDRPLSARCASIVS